MSDERDKWFWCLDHQRVETYDGCKSSRRLGPYDTADEAARALETAAARTEAWDNDPRWNDDA